MTDKEFNKFDKHYNNLVKKGTIKTMNDACIYKLAIEKAIKVIRCCETLKDKETPTLKDAFIAGYKKRALMSGLKYDEVSKLSAITNFKCWKSFDLNL